MTIYKWKQEFFYRQNTEYMLGKTKTTEAEVVFEILVRENQAMILTYLRAVVWDQSVIDDLFQETMLIAWKRLPDFDHSRPFGPWLRGIAAKTVMAHMRKTKSKDIMLFAPETLQYLSEQLQHINEGPGDTWDEKTETLTHCIEGLSDHYRQAIELRYFQQASVPKIAETSKTTVKNIQKRLQRARSQLLDCLRRKKGVMEITI